MKENAKDVLKLDRTQNKRGSTVTCTRRKSAVDNTETKREEMAGTCVA